MTSSFFRAALAATALLGVCSCAAPSGSPAAPHPTPHALILGLDGVRPDAFQAAKTPHLDRLIEAGLVTWDAFAGGADAESDPTTQATSSGPGWTSILTGVWHDRHHVADNTFQGADLANNPHLFARIRAVRPTAQLVSIVHWAPINEHLLRPYPSQASLLLEPGSDSAVAAAGAAQIRDADPAVLFLHFDEVDSAGHSFGYGAPIAEYIAAIELVDLHVGVVLDALQERESRTGEEWLVIATTDHGGLGTGHGGQSAEERTIWITAKGPGIQAGVLTHGPGHTIVALTVLDHMGVHVPSSEGFADEVPFGLLTRDSNPLQK
jgi:predicted AlkP superfamily pyrophosphatase or phosphodiesterase